MLVSWLSEVLPAGVGESRHTIATMRQVTIATVTDDDLVELLTLMRAYCDFYQAGPADDALLAVSRALIADPER